MTTSELHPSDEGELQPKSRVRLDRATMYGILSVAAAVVIVAATIWLSTYTSLWGKELMDSDPRWSQRLENLLCLSPVAVCLLAFIGVLVAVPGIAAGRKQGLRSGCLLSAAGLVLNITIALLYLGVWLIFGSEQMF